MAIDYSQLYATSEPYYTPPEEEVAPEEAGAARSYAELPFLKGVSGIGGAVGYGLEAVGAERIGRALQESDSRAQAALTARQSRQAQEDAQKSLITDTGEYGGYNMGTLSQQVFGSLPSTLAMGLVGAPLAKGASMAAGALGVGQAVASRVGKVAASGTLGKSLAAGVNQAIGSAVGFGASEGVFSGASNASQLQTQIRNTDLEQLAAHPMFEQVLMNETDSQIPFEERANQTREIIAKRAADETFADTMIKTGLISMATGGGMFGMIRNKAVTQGAEKAAGGVIGSAIKGMAVEGAQEGAQSALEEQTMARAQQKYTDQTVNPEAGMAGAGAEGFIAGAVMGAFGGGASSQVKGKPGQPKPDADTGDQGQKPLGLPAPAQGIGEDRTQNVPSRMIVFEDGSQISADEFLRDRIAEHGDEAKARRETFMALNGKPKPVIGIPELVFAADGSSFNKADLIKGFTDNGYSEDDAKAYISKIVTLPVEERTAVNLDPYRFLQERDAKTLQAGGELNADNTGQGVAPTIEGTTAEDQGAGAVGGGTPPSDGGSAGELTGRGITGDVGTVPADQPDGAELPTADDQLAGNALAPTGETLPPEVTIAQPTSETEPVGIEPTTAAKPFYQMDLPEYIASHPKPYQTNIKILKTDLSKLSDEEVLKQFGKGDLREMAAVLGSKISGKPADILNGIRTVQNNMSKMANMTDETLSAMTVGQLKELNKSLGVSTFGNKSALIATAQRWRPNVVKRSQNMVAERNLIKELTSKLNSGVTDIPTASLSRYADTLLDKATETVNPNTYASLVRYVAVKLDSAPFNQTSVKINNLRTRAENSEDKFEKRKLLDVANALQERDDNRRYAEKKQVQPASVVETPTTTQPETEPTTSQALPAILTKKQNGYVLEAVREFKKQNPKAIKSAVDDFKKKVTDSYESDYNEALAKAPFEFYAGLPEHKAMSSDLLKSSYNALRDEYQLPPVDFTQAKGTTNAKTIPSDQGVPAQTGQVGEGGQADSGGNVYQSEQGSPQGGDGTAQGRGAEGSSGAEGEKKIDVGATPTVKMRKADKRVVIYNPEYKFSTDVGNWTISFAPASHEVEIEKRGLSVNAPMKDGENFVVRTARKQDFRRGVLTEKNLSEWPKDISPQLRAALIQYSNAQTKQEDEAAQDAVMTALENELKKYASQTEAKPETLQGLFDKLERASTKEFNQLLEGNPLADRIKYVEKEFASILSDIGYQQGDFKSDSEIPANKKVKFKCKT